VILSTCLLLALATAGAQEPEAPASPYSVPDLLAELRLLDQADLSTEIVRRYTRLVAQVGPLGRQGEALAIVAAATFATGEEARAKQLLYRAVTTQPSYHFVELQRVRFLMEEDQLAQALKELTETRRNGQRKLRYPQAPESWLLLAKIHARLEQYPQASPAAVRFLALAPRHRESSSAWHILAQAAIRSHDLDHARTCRQRAEELSAWYGLLKARSLQVIRQPDEPLPRLGLALLWMEARDYGAARRELVVLTSSFPEFCRGWFHLAEADRLGFDDDDALASYDRALACDPGHAPARMNRGMLRFELGRPDEARADLEQLVAGAAGDDPVYASAHLFLARIHLRAGDREKADASYARYGELGGTEALE